MQARLEKIDSSPGASLRFIRADGPRFWGVWHFHPELELTWITEGAGTRHVGDSQETFGPGDLVLVGSGLPHFWQSRHPAPRGALARARVVQFRTDLAAGELWKLPEAEGCGKLLATSGRGWVFPADAARELAPLWEELEVARGLGRVGSLLRMLELLSRHPGRALASRDYRPPGTGGADRLARVHQYLDDHYGNRISLARLAQVAAMTPEAFCRFFRQQTGSTPGEQLRRLRLEKACHLLATTDRRVADLAHECGFGSFSAFHRAFLRHRGVTPALYRRKLR